MAKKIAKITSGGRVTIPTKIRAALNLRKGDTVTFELNDDGSARLCPVRGESVFAKYKGIGRKGGKGMTLEEILAERRALRGW